MAIRKTEGQFGLWETVFRENLTSCVPSYQIFLENGLPPNQTLPKNINDMDLQCHNTAD